ncbi:MAG: glucuronate isomerase [Opitutaceae bacterium]|nr:glucuronate isomerase [Opitutaceae bacterium]
MNPFNTDAFLLSTDTAWRLYRDVAAPLPIIDYHNHLDARALAADAGFSDVTALWIASDPYKHRAMRILGVPEAQITGDADARTKFNRWAESVPQLIGNPLYDWTALELLRFFGIDEPLSPASADRTWAACNEKLRSPEFTARGLLTRANVEVVCTSDNLDDDLSTHSALASSGFGTRVVPSLRDAARVDAARFDAFARLGCPIADHAVSDPEQLPALAEVAAEYARRGWTMQLHLGALRETSSRLRRLAGPAGGYAGIAPGFDLVAVARFLDALEQQGSLPRTILFPLNPVDYAATATLTGSFAEAGVPGKVQLGPAWWWNDHRLGMRQHLDALASYGALSTFIGMTTDSRSFLSTVRHEYFRRILCEWIGEQVEGGRFPNDEALLANLLRKLCYQNAKDFLKL